MTARTLRKEGRTGGTVEQQRKHRIGPAKHPKVGKSGTSSGSNGQNLGGMSKGARDMLKFCERERAMHIATRELLDAEELHYGVLPRSRPDSHPFDEKKFGYPITRAAFEAIPCSVVSFALFDGETKLFACSGIPIPRGRAALVSTRYVTSARLAREYIRNSYRDDKLKIEVRHPDGNNIDGFLELYNRHIAIVTVLDYQSVQPVELEREVIYSDGVVIGRAFGTGGVMSAKVKHVSPSSYDPDVCFPVSLQFDLPMAQEYLQIWKPVYDSEGDPVAVLGAPVLGKDGVLGMFIDVGHEDSLANGHISFLPLHLLYLYLRHFRVLNPKELHFRGYVLPYGVHTIIPSGFMKRIYRLKHFGYPMPPPLMLQLNGRLRNTFEECFGEIVAWKGYPFNVICCNVELVWQHLPKGVLNDMSRRVVSIASFHGYERYFVCTGLFIKWHQHTVVLTSASLVRSCTNEDEIDNTLKIEVFLPQKQRASGKLEFYSLNYNIAIVSVKKKFVSVSPENISNKDPLPKSSGKVVALGREPRQGLLMASIGELKRRDKGCKLDCKDVKLSTCRIRKAGIGGPLINFDGSFVGMNFFDGRSLAPFLPRSKIVQVLGSKVFSSLPSERGDDVPVHIKDAGGELRENRWPVPELYWYHGQLDVDMKEHYHVGVVKQ